MNKLLTLFLIIIGLLIISVFVLQITGEKKDENFTDQEPSPDYTVGCKNDYECNMNTSMCFGVGMPAFNCNKKCDNKAECTTPTSGKERIPYCRCRI